MALNWKVATALALAVPASTMMGQASMRMEQASPMIGVSHPDEAPVMTSQEGVRVEPVYRATPPQVSAAATPVLKPRAGVGSGADGASATEPPLGASATRRGLPVEPDVDANIVMGEEGPANQLPVGTLIKIRIEQGLTTLQTTQGTVFSGKLLTAVEHEGRVLLPAGSVLSGRVTDVHGGRRITGAASIHLEPTTITLPDGTKYAMHAQVIDSDLFKSTKIDHEGTIVRRDHPKETLSVVTLATGSGAAAGAVLGGVPGALIGAGVGAGVSTAVWLKQDRQTGVPVNTRIVFALTSPMVVGGS